MKLVDLNYTLKKYDGSDNGIAAEVAAIQTVRYINRMQAIGESQIVADMSDAKTQFEQTNQANMTDSQFNTVYDWILNHSGFYGEARTQLINSFDNAIIT